MLWSHSDALPKSQALYRKVEFKKMGSLQSNSNSRSKKIETHADAHNSAIDVVMDFLLKLTQPDMETCTVFCVLNTFVCFLKGKRSSQRHEASQTNGKISGKPNGGGRSLDGSSCDEKTKKDS